jgi:hypothetical protein
MNIVGEEVLIQDWVTIAGLGSDVVQDPCCIVDTLGLSRCRLHALVTDAGATGVLSIDGASALDGPWSQVLAVNPTAGTPGEYYYDFEVEGGDSASPSYQLPRYLRWRASGGSSDVLCFMLAAIFE